MERLILARHGESTYSARGLCNGDPSVPVGLTARGREQARELGVAIRDEAIDLCVTSRFPRTQETADIALEGRPIPRLVLPELDDIEYGQLEGSSRATYQAYTRAHGWSVPLPGGESKVEVAHRMAASLEILLARSESTLLVVTHEMPVGLALRALRNGVPVGPPDEIQYARPYPLSADDARRASGILGTWEGTAAG
jgi:broad specificity phosphatase PhoE